jgi:hypothetical protein
MNPLKEKEIQSAIVEYLKLKRIFHYRNNTGAFVDKNNHMYRFGALGSPDVVAVKDGRYIAIEVKTAKGIQSDAQLNFQRELERAGGQYILARSLDEIIKIFP